jgi:Ser/Thr protein kinase RdoA (MazF antagonist)
MIGAPPTPTDVELTEAVERILGRAGIGPVLEVRRRHSEYRTSFPLEELDVALEDSTSLRLAFKRLGWDGLDQEARLAKPRFLHDPRREAAVYASLLEPAAIGAPRYYGSVIEPGRERYWLFVVWVEGRELYQVGERELWKAAARWLGRMHTELGDGLDRRAAAGRLIDHDGAFYRRWMERAREFARAPGRPASHATAVEWLGERHEPVVEALLALPKTVIHGEFYASNVLVDAESAAPRVAPVDWELAATGPGLTDLAALVSGDWSGDDREALVRAYGSVAHTSPRDLEFARLQLSIQWLGWAPPTWKPPPGQRQDWLAEALALAEGLGL